MKKGASLKKYLLRLLEDNQFNTFFVPLLLLCYYYYKSQGNHTTLKQWHFAAIMIIPFQAFYKSL